MKTIDDHLIKIWQDGKAACFEFEKISNVLIHSGQFLMARGGEDLLPVPVYPIGEKKGMFTSMGSAGCHWKVGDQLFITGPHGNGFKLPPVSRRLLLISSTSTPLRLIPAASEIISLGGEVALYAENFPQNFPVEVELLAKDQLEGALNWADCIIGDTRLKAISRWIDLFSGIKSSPIGRGVQLLVDTPLVCAGKSECGVCAVKTKNGWKQACSDGPVFLLDDLELT